MYQTSHESTLRSQCSSLNLRRPGCLRRGKSTCRNGHYANNKITVDKLSTVQVAGLGRRPHASCVIGYCPQNIWPFVAVKTTKDGAWLNNRQLLDRKHVGICRASFPDIHVTHAPGFICCADTTSQLTGLGSDYFDRHGITEAWFNAHIVNKQRDKWRTYKPCRKYPFQSST